MNSGSDVSVVFYICILFVYDDSRVSNAQSQRERVLAQKPRSTFSVADTLSCWPMGGRTFLHARLVLDRPQMRNGHHVLEVLIRSALEDRPLLRIVALPIQSIVLDGTAYTRPFIAQMSPCGTCTCVNNDSSDSLAAIEPEH